MQRVLDKQKRVNQFCFYTSVLPLTMKLVDIARYRRNGLSIVRRAKSDSRGRIPTSWIQIRSAITWVSGQDCCLRVNTTALYRSENLCASLKSVSMLILAHECVIKTNTIPILNLYRFLIYPFSSLCIATLHSSVSL